MRITRPSAAVGQINSIWIVCECDIDLFREHPKRKFMSYTVAIITCQIILSQVYSCSCLKCVAASRKKNKTLRTVQTKGIL